MGMYDHLKCELPLSILGNDSNKVLFQTKSLGSQLDTYIISSGGRLFYEEQDKSLSARVFTGTIAFYTITPEWDWLEYEAYFKKGSICSLVLTQSKKSSSIPPPTAPPESEWTVL